MFKSWMKDNWNYIKNKKLSEVCLPGSHDAGMSFIAKNYKGDNHTIGLGAGESNCLNQRLSIEKQLQSGIRFFDIRPCAYNDSGYFASKSEEKEFHCGHYTEIAGTTTGARGESIKSVINSVNNFTSIPENSKEIIVIYLSHAYFIDEGMTYSTQADLSPEKWSELMENFSQINGLFVKNNNENRRVSDLRMEEFIASGKSAVLVFVQKNINEFKSLGLNKFRGIYPEDEYPTYSNFREKNFQDNDATASVEEWTAKQLTFISGHHGSMPMLKWAAPVVISDLRSEADNANGKLSHVLDMVNNINNLPRVIEVDCADERVTAVAVKLNQKFKL